MSNSDWSSVPEAPQDKIFGLKEVYSKDERPDVSSNPSVTLGQAKVNITAGVYIDEHGHVPVMEAFKKAKEQQIATDQGDSYQPMRGHADFISVMQELMLGKALTDSVKLASVQTLGGTGALRTCGDFLRLAYPKAVMHVSSPTWANHKGIFTAVGMPIESYPYYNLSSHQIDFEAMRGYLEQLPLLDSEGKHVILLHTCCHNPTGADLSSDRFEELKQIFSARADLFPVFDFAYQGFGKGVDEDAGPIRMFAEAGMSFAVCQSASKNCSMYGQRVGCLSVTVDDDQERSKIENVLSTLLIRRNYSNPPKYGAELVYRVMSDPALKEEWLSELNHIRNRIAQIRSQFVDSLAAKDLGEKFAFIRNECGMFSVLGLSSTQDELLRREYGVYLPDGGRIAFPSLTDSNMDYVASAIKAVFDRG